MRFERWRRISLVIVRIVAFVLSGVSSYCRVLNRDISDNFCFIGRVFVRSK